MIELNSHEWRAQWRIYVFYAIYDPPVKNKYSYAFLKSVLNAYGCPLGYIVNVNFIGSLNNSKHKLMHLWQWVFINTFSSFSKMFF